MFLNNFKVNKMFLVLSLISLAMIFSLGTGHTDASSVIYVNGTHGSDA